MHKLWTLFILIFSLVIAILVVTLPQTSLGTIFRITTLFDVMIPFLAVGALVKYITNSCCKKD